MRLSGTVLIVFCAATAIAAQTLEPPRLRLPGNVQPVRYEASLELAPGQDRFTGRIRIDLNILESTSVIWLNARSLQFQNGRILAGASETPVRLEPSGDNFVAVLLDRPRAPGKAQLEIGYSGEVSRTLTDGAFQQQQGEDWYIFTKFEPVTARRVFPCFDEPSYKVPWRITLTFPKGLKAFSNTPAVSTKENGATTTVAFKETKPLPSYLVAFAIGPFDEVSTEPIGRNRIAGRIIVPRGRADEAAYAASITPKLIALLESYFGRPYPYAKLDQVIVPVTTSWGAMENAGLIAYGDFLLAPRAQETQLVERRTAEVMEHEMAHQWFGDLVTMAWWDDLWLNEAFASWVESKLLNEWKPEWNINADAARSVRVFRADSLTTARKIRQPIEAPGDIANAFDGITYGKGEAVIAMFENYVGSAAFQRAVQLYLSKHEWRNATSADLLGAIDEIAPEKHTGAAFSTFLNQVGFPLLTVKENCGTYNELPSFGVTQSRFVPLGSPAGEASAATNETWQVPVCVASSDGSGAHGECNLLAKTSETFPLRSAKSCPQWLFADANAAGYYAVSYDARISGELMHDGLNQLAPAERAALLRNTQLLFSSGLGDLRQDLDSMTAFSRSSDPGLLDQSVQFVAGVEPFVAPDRKASYATWIRDLFDAKAHELGWKPQAGESLDILQLRMNLVPLVAMQGEDMSLRNQAEKLARAWLADKSLLNPDMVPSVLSAAAWAGGRPFFDALVNAIRQDKIQRERGWMIAALPYFRDPQLARAALDLLFQPGIDPREMQYNFFSRPDETQEIVWSFVQQNFDRINSTLPGARGIPFGAILPLAAVGFCDASHAEQVKSFFEPRLSSLPGGGRNLANTLERIRLCSAREEVTRAAVTEFLNKE